MRRKIADCFRIETLLEDAYNERMSAPVAVRAVPRSREGVMRICGEGARLECARKRRMYLQGRREGKRDERIAAASPTKITQPILYDENKPCERGEITSRWKFYLHIRRKVQNDCIEDSLPGKRMSHAHIRTRGRGGRRKRRAVSEGSAEDDWNPGKRRKRGHRDARANLGVDVRTSHWAGGAHTYTYLGSVRMR